jgi:hypothetical protein
MKTRIRRKFLLFPKTLKGIRKWFKMVYVKQQYIVNRNVKLDPELPTYGDLYFWKDIEFIK